MLQKVGFFGLAAQISPWVYHVGNMNQTSIILGVVLAAAAIVGGIIIFTDDNSGIETTNTSTVESDGSENDSGAIELPKNLNFGTINMAFEHVAPGEYSEVYVIVSGEPGEGISVVLEGPSIEPPAEQLVFADENGQAHFTYRIYEYGEYEANVIYGDDRTTGIGTVLVE